MGKRTHPLGAFILGPPTPDGELKRKPVVSVRHRCGNTVWVEPGKRVRCHVCGRWVEEKP